MIVRELINQLQSLDQDLLVLVSGYETGYNDLTEIEVIEVKLSNSTAGYDGKYNYIGTYDTAPPLCTACLLL